MNLSNQERVFWGALVTALALYGYYFATALNASNEDFNGSSAIRLMLAMTGLVVIEVIYSIVFPLKPRVELEGKQDAEVEGRASRTAHGLLVAGLFLSITAIVMSNLFSASPAAQFIMRPFITVNLLFLCVVLSEVAKFVVRSFFHRRSV